MTDSSSVSPQQELQAGAAQGIGAALSLLPAQPGWWSWGDLGRWGDVPRFGHSAPGQQSPGTLQGLWGSPCCSSAGGLLPGWRWGQNPPLFPHCSSLGTDDIKLWGCQIASICAEGLTWHVGSLCCFHSSLLLEGTRAVICCFICLLLLQYFCSLYYSGAHTAPCEMACMPYHKDKLCMQ